MSIYAIIVAIVYGLGAVGLGIAALLLLLSGVRDRNYREFARRLMAIAVGAIASGVLLIPIYKVLANLAKGAEPSSPRALILGGAIPILLGTAIGLLANRLLREKSARATRLLILLNAAFGTYMLIGLAGLYTVLQSYKTTESDLSSQIQELKTSASGLESSAYELKATADQTVRSMKEAQELSKGVATALQALRVKFDQLNRGGQFTSLPYLCSLPGSWVDNFREVTGEMTRSSTALRSSIQAHGSPTDCKTENDTCLDSLLTRTSKATEQAAALSHAISRISVDIAIYREQQVQEGILAILPNLVFIMGAFLVITLSKD